MAVVGDIYNALDAFCPFDVHEQWDNVGLLVGESSAQVTRATVVLDITPDAVERAHEAGAQLIISHHPVIFHPIKNLGAHDPVYLLLSAPIQISIVRTAASTMFWRIA